eukprot:608477-Prymnesium_polylepis.1
MTPTCPSVLNAPAASSRAFLTAASSASRSDVTRAAAARYSSAAGEGRARSSVRPFACPHRLHGEWVVRRG